MSGRQGSGGEPSQNLGESPHFFIVHGFPWEQGQHRSGILRQVGDKSRAESPQLAMLLGKEWPAAAASISQKVQKPAQPLMANRRSIRHLEIAADQARQVRRKRAV